MANRLNYTDIKNRAQIWFEQKYSCTPETEYGKHYEVAGIEIHDTLDIIQLDFRNEIKDEYADNLQELEDILIKISEEIADKNGYECCLKVEHNTKFHD